MKSTNSGQKTRPSVDQKIKVDFHCSRGTQNKNECEKISKYLNVARGHKKRLNMRVNGITIVLYALGTIPRRLEKDWKDWKSE